MCVCVCVCCVCVCVCVMREGAQVWRGRITIAYREEELREAVARLQKLAVGELAGTQCAVAPAPDGRRFRV